MIYSKAMVLNSSMLLRGLIDRLEGQNSELSSRTKCIRFFELLLHLTQILFVFSESLTFLFLLSRLVDWHLLFPSLPFLNFTKHPIVEHGVWFPEKLLMVWRCDLDKCGGVGGGMGRESAPCGVITDQWTNRRKGIGRQVFFPSFLSSSLL